MSDIFLSYASADRERVRPLVEALTDLGWSVWWDREIPVGMTWPEVIEARLDDAEVMVVVWTRESVQSEWVAIEASEGKRRKLLVPVRLDDVDPPLEFRRIQAADLTGPSLSPDSDGMKALKLALSGFLEPAREVTPEASAATSTTEGDATRGRGVRRRARRLRWPIGIALLLVGLLAAWAWGGSWHGSGIPAERVVTVLQPRDPGGVLAAGGSELLGITLGDELVLDPEWSLVELSAEVFGERAMVESGMVDPERAITLGRDVPPSLALASTVRPAVGAGGAFASDSIDVDVILFEIEGGTVVARVAVRGPVLDPAATAREIVQRLSTAVGGVELPEASPAADAPSLDSFGQGLLLLAYGDVTSAGQVFEAAARDSEYAPLLAAARSTRAFRESPLPTVAVLEFAGFVPDSAALGANLGKAVQTMMITELSGQPGFAVVERLQLQALLDERELASSGLVDEETAIEIGKRLGARYLLRGSVNWVGEAITVSTRATDVETGRGLFVVRESSPVTDLFPLVIVLADRVTAELGRQPSPVPDSAFLTLADLLQEVGLTAQAEAYRALAAR